MSKRHISAKHPLRRQSRPMVALDPVNDYQGQRRVLHCILLAGAKPIPAA